MVPSLLVLRSNVMISQRNKTKQKKKLAGNFTVLMFKSRFCAEVKKSKAVIHSHNKSSSSRSYLQFLIRNAFVTNEEKLQFLSDCNCAFKTD